MTRKPNTTQPSKPGLVLIFRPHEFGLLKLNTPGPSGKLGGYPREENWLVANTDPVTFRCELDAVHLERLIRYCTGYGPGGPNKRLRAACIPALRRVGIELLPGLSA